MRFTLSILSILLASSTQAGTCDHTRHLQKNNWQEFNKHVALSGLATAATGNAWAGFAISAALAAGEEVLERRPGHEKDLHCPSWKDLGMPVLGSALGATAVGVYIGPQSVRIDWMF